MKVFQFIKKHLRERRAHGSESGVALVEFALILPLVIVILFGILDFGRAFNYWIDMTHLSNEGSRWAAVNRNPGAPETLQRYLQCNANTEELKNGGSQSVPDALLIDLQFPNGGTPLIGDPVVVTATTTFNWLPFLGDAVGVGSTSITASSTMRLEQIPDMVAYQAGAGGTGIPGCP